MKITLDKSGFVSRMLALTYRHDFSPEGLEVLFDYLQKTDENLKFKPSDIASKFAEYSSLEEFKESSCDEIIQELESVEEIHGFLLCLPIEGGGFITENI